jgi:hypothetical protein
MEIKSKASGLTVTMSDEDYGVLLAKHGEHGAYQEILNKAGRVLQHRMTLDEIRNQTLTDEQKAQVEGLAKSLAIQAIINKDLRDMGYGEYLKRRDAGAMLPESWGRTVSQSRERCADEIEYVEVTDADRNHAMTELGFYIKKDAEWSHRVADWCDWTITAPEGWGEPSNSSSD